MTIGTEFAPALSPKQLSFAKNLPPNQSQVFVSSPLTNVAIAFIQEESKFVWNQVFPTVLVDMPAGQYYSLSDDDFNRDEMAPRAPGTEAVEIGWDLDPNNTYSITPDGVRTKIPDEVIASQQMPIDLDMQATARLSLAHNIRQERRWADNFFNSTTWGAGNTRTGVAAAPTNVQFLQFTNDDADPIGTFRAAMDAIEGSTGFRPNTLTVTRDVESAIIDHPNVIARVNRGQTTGPAQANMDDLARVLGLDRVLVMSSVVNTAKKGAATQATAFTATNSALLTYRPTSPGIMVPSSGYYFKWRRFPGGSEGVRVSRWFDQNTQSTLLQLDSAMVPKLTAAKSGMFFANVLTT